MLLLLCLWMFTAWFMAAGLSVIHKHQQVTLKKRRWSKQAIEFSLKELLLLHCSFIVHKHWPSVPNADWFIWTRLQTRLKTAVKIQNVQQCLWITMQKAFIWSESPAVRNFPSSFREGSVMLPNVDFYLWTPMRKQFIPNVSGSINTSGDTEITTVI